MITKEELSYMTALSIRKLPVKQLLRRIPYFKKIRVKELQWERRFMDWRQGTSFATHRTEEHLPNLVKKHKSVLRRVLEGTDPRLQDNKIVNLRLSVQNIDGVLIRPGETFSLWKLVGSPSAKKGYIDGLTISYGAVQVGVGGGLCQLANLIFWLALHTPMEIVERHHHSFDLFPDNQRTVPFGSGTSIFYNYMDLRFRNPTEHTFQLQLWLTERFLEGSINSDSFLPCVYRIEERGHRFEKQDGVWFRKNEIWQFVLDPSDNRVLEEKLMIRNCSEVKYPVDETLAQA
jgi:vancomycin resistance protein VanW